MNTTSFADPSARGATRVLRRLHKHQDDHDSIEDYDFSLPLGGLVRMLGGTMVLGASLYLVVFGTTRPGITAGWLGLTASVLYGAWATFQSEPVTNWLYKRHLRNGTIIEVPNGLVAMWDEVAAETPGFPEWSEYDKHRFAVLASLLFGAKHLLRPLFYECPCGKPASCESTKHFSATQKTDAAASLACLVEVELAEHTTAFAAHRAAIDEVRASQLVLGV